MEENRFYTYVYLDPRKPGNYTYNLENGEILNFDYEPFYVGKGTGNRMFLHKFKSKEKRRFHMYYKIQKIIKDSSREPIIIKYKDGLSNDDAYKLEELLIDKIGRLVSNDGPLINKIRGGYGTKGYIPTKETLEKRSIGIRNYYKNNKHVLYGIKRPLEVREKISKSRMGIKNDRSSHLKSTKTRNVKPILQYDLNGKFIREWEMLSDVKHTLGICIKNINSCIKGQRNFAAGYIWRRKTDGSYPEQIEINFKIRKNNAEFK